MYTAKIHLYSNDNSNNNNNNYDNIYIYIYIYAYAHIICHEGTATSNAEQETIIKVCGMTDENEVKEALTSGVDLIGLIFAKSPRSVSQDKARSIVNVVRKYGERDKRIIFQKEISMLKDVNIKDGDDIDRSRYWYQRMAAYIRGTTKRTPLTVGVFQDHSAEEINDVIEITGIDVVQLHGNEDPDVIEHINAPCIKVLHIPATMGGGA